MTKTRDNYSPWPRSWLLRILAFIWTLPVGVLSLPAILLWVVSGWSKPTIADGAISCTVGGPFGRRMYAKGWGAFTASAWTSWFWDAREADSEVTRSHEARHRRQAIVLGPLIVVVWPLALLVNGYDDSILEVDARAHEVVSWE